MTIPSYMLRIIAYEHWFVNAGCHADADISLFTIDDLFVIGYGLDCAEIYRNLPYIAEYNNERNM